MHRLRSTCILAAVALPLSHPAGAAATPPAPTLTKLLLHYGFDASAQDAVTRGTIVSNGVDESSEKELAVAVVMRVESPPAEVFAALRDGLTLRANDDIIAFARLGADSSKALDHVVYYTDEETGEARDLLNVEPGDDFNLSRGEIARCTVLARKFEGRREQRSARCRLAISAAMRDILRARLAAYRRGGAAAIAPYERDEDGDDPARPGDELMAAAAAETFLAGYDPALHRVCSTYPRETSRDVEHQFFVIKQTVEDRPAFSLAHRMARSSPAVATLVERQFYVGHTYNSLQSVTTLLPDKEGTIVAVVTRTATDRVAGFGTSVAHRLGRNRMKEAIEMQMARLRRTLVIGN